MDMEAPRFSAEAIIRCMRSLQAPGMRETMNESERQQVDDALDPPTGLIVASASLYVLTYGGPGRALRARPLLRQLVACAPPAAALCLGGLVISQRLLQDLLQRNGEPSPVSAELRKHCSELLNSPS
ncbi:unnamed protein product [Durusdinium trenchii]|uniref:Uncharacterized protein n=1 Tax=Durusdinium trenchii TaxID=1381693 RepID=A0ABP0LVE7_9DINO